MSIPQDRLRQYPFVKTLAHKLIMIKKLGMKIMTENLIAKDRVNATTEVLSDWQSVMEALSSFPAPRISFDGNGEIDRTSWIFRGHRCASYSLEPSIERAAKNKFCSWSALESIILSEFQAKARMYQEASALPPADDKLSWLAAMQHFGVPTRLLDFTYSPYVALYFALRNNPQSDRSAIWAINTDAILSKSRSICCEADEQVANADGKSTGDPVNFGDLRFYATDADLYRRDGAFWARSLADALSPDGIRRDCFNKAGFVAFALPPAQNRRLSNQQGAFLLSAAEELTFEESLFKMMEHENQWCRRFEVPADVRTTLESRLFQMNIHELSLFPDMEGLAGFIGQKVRLHWEPS